jgi:uncharacterized protein YajQ (UPF0234 family)
LPDTTRTPVRVKKTRQINNLESRFDSIETEKALNSAANQEASMPVDSDSAIAWHRAQLRKLRETLRNIDTAMFTVGEPAQSTRTGKTQTTIAELQQKIRQSQQIIAAYERQTRRPLTTDQQTLASASWSNWNAQAAPTRSNNSR